MKAFIVAIAIAAVFRLPVEAVTVDRANVRLGQTPFAELEKTLGQARRTNGGDGDTGGTQTCYRSRGGASVTIFFTSGEMGGGDRITEVGIVAAEATSADYYPPIATDCALLPPGPVRIRSDRGVRLGMTRHTLELNLGRPSQDSAGVATYEAEGVRWRSGVRYDVTSKLRIRYDRDRVVAFDAIGFATL